jgi:hypothetical protein
MFKIGDRVIYSGDIIIIKGFVWKTLYNHLEPFKEYIVQDVMPRHYENNSYIRIIKIWYPDKCFYNKSEMYKYMSKKYGLL